VVVGVWLAVGTVAVFYWKWNQGGESRADLNLARTAALTTLVLFQKVHVFNCRSETTSIFKTPLLANKVLFAGVLASLAIHIAAIYIPVTQTLLSLRPLDALTWAVAAGVALTAIIVNELHKRFRP
jgi:magnesium-transporting ATPase (P-type)